MGIGGSIPVQMVSYLTGLVSVSVHTNNILYKMGQPRPLLLSTIRCFQTNIITIFPTNICEKCPSCRRYQDLNPRPSEHESPPITTRPGLPPKRIICLLSSFNNISTFESPLIASSYITIELAITRKN